MTDVASFYHVLVVGAVKTGKTTLLANLCHSQQGDYEPTIYAQKFVDSHRKLVFIDTPGIKDIILTQGSGLNDHTQGRFASFSDDSLVRELRGAHMDQSQYRLLADPYISNKLVNNMNSIDAVLIVYTDDKQSQQMAKALRFLYHRKLIEDEEMREQRASAAAIGTASNMRSSTTATASAAAAAADTTPTLRIFTLRNTGDFNRRDVLSSYFAQLNASNAHAGAGAHAAAAGADGDRASKNAVPGLGGLQLPFQDDIDSIYSDEPVVDTRPRYRSCIPVPDVNAMRESTVDESLFRVQAQLGLAVNDDALDDDNGDGAVADKTSREQCGGGCTIV